MGMCVCVCVQYVYNRKHRPQIPSISAAGTQNGFSKKKGFVYNIKRLALIHLMLSFSLDLTQRLFISPPPPAARAVPFCFDRKMLCCRENRNSYSDKVKIKFNRSKKKEAKIDIDLIIIWHSRKNVRVVQFIGLVYLIWGRVEHCSCHKHPSEKGQAKERWIERVR